MNPNVVVLKDGDCSRCDGCGYIASGDDGAPWRAWMDLPMQSAIAVQMGWVTPVVCPTCDGTGSSTAA